MMSECIALNTDNSLEGGGSLAASLEQKKEEGNGRLARWGRKSRAGRPCPSFKCLF
jgi:hypothetical protein